MAFDVSAIKAKPTAVPKRENKRVSRDLGPNPWLDKTWAQGLQASYDNDEAYSADFPGAIEMQPARRGEKKGELIEKVTGDAKDAITLIRAAGEKLGIGVAVRTKKGRNGFVNVTWYGQTRKQRRSDETVSPADSTPAVTE